MSKALDSKIYKLEQNIEELKDQMEKTARKQQKVENNLKRSEQHNEELWDDYKRHNKRIYRLPKAKKGGWEEKGNQGG